MASAKVLALALELGPLLEEVWADLLVLEWVLVSVLAWALEWVQA